MSSNLNAGTDDEASTFIAVRYDSTHVIFRLGDDGDFYLNDQEEKRIRRIQSPIFRFDDVPLEGMGKKAAEGMSTPVWELGPKLLDAHRDSFDKVHAGEQWQLELSADSRIPVVVEKPVALPWGCDNSSYTAAFIAEALPGAQAALAAAPKRYFLVHKSPAAFSAKPGPNQAQIRALFDWKPTPEVRSSIEQAIDAQLKAVLASEQPSGSYADAAKQFAEQAALGKVKLIYETDALQLSPDGFPLLFVRARWMADQQHALLMAFWLRVGPEVKREVVVGYANAVHWLQPWPPSAATLTEEAVSLNQLDHVLNVFDRHGDGYGEVLMYQAGYENFAVRLIRYTQTGLVLTKISMGDGC